jgi:hypothetical protein
MPDRSPLRSSPTWLVEQYRPGSDSAELDRQAARVRTIAIELARSGARLAYLGTTIVPTDEALLTVIAADSIDDVRSLFERAGAPAPRITAAVHDLPRATRRRPAPPRTEIPR